MKRFFRALLLLPLSAVLYVAGAAAGSVYLDKAQIRVVDGDTLNYHGRAIRILGLQAPERRAVCAAEAALAQSATEHADYLVEGAKTIRAVFQYKKTRDGKVVRATDKYGRYLAHVWVARQDWAAWMIDAGLAKPWDGKGSKPSWCPAAPAAG